jgi:hypothetical protein
VESEGVGCNWDSSVFGLQMQQATQAIFCIARTCSESSPPVLRELSDLASPPTRPAVRVPHSRAWTVQAAILPAER